MEKKKYAFMLLGAQYNPAQHCSHFETQGMDTYIVTVSSFEQAYEAVKKLDNMGVGALEVCGAFGEERAKELRLPTAEWQLALLRIYPSRMSCFIVSLVIDRVETDRNL